MTKYELQRGMKLTAIDRTKRVKEARDEAKKEIEAYRKSKDEEFKKFESEVCWPWQLSLCVAPKLQLGCNQYVMK